MVKYYNDNRRVGYFHDGGPATYGNTCLKLICSLILHLIMQPCVLPPIQRLFYILNHREQFEQLFVPLCICIMKFVAEIGLEYTLMVSTAYEND